MLVKRFEKKVVAVTGASRGIGAGIAERFASEGAIVILCANESLVRTTADQLRDKYGSCEGFVVDVTNKTQVEAFFQGIQDRYGRLDVAVNNAGVITISRLAELAEQDWDRVMDVNTKGVFLCSQAAAKFMVAQKSGVIINTASGQARQGFIYTPHYAASKFGVVGLTQSLAKELASSGIRVNAFCPGIIDTDMWSYNDRVWGGLLGDYKAGELMADWVKEIPLKRVGTPADVAALVAFLASSDASYITGQTINIDGGMFMS